MRSAAQLRPVPPDLKADLTEALSKGFECRAHYVHTAPRRCDPLFSAPPGVEAEVTRLASHFLTISINADQDDTINDVFVLGIEVLVYSTKYLTTIFVSKADSTGYSPKQQPSAAKTIITTFVDWLTKTESMRHPAREIVISLFARSQSQYLFPGSAENAGKHILDDRQLIKWWLRVLNPIFPSLKEGKEKKDVCRHQGYLTIPGYEGISELRNFMPRDNQPFKGEPRWIPGNPLSQLVRTGILPENPPIRCLLPRFPDDPKARFIRDLDGEVGLSENTETTTSPKKSRAGQWATIRDLDSFWEAMSFRQECSSGRLVGFIWLVKGSPTSKPIETAETAAQRDADLEHARIDNGQPPGNVNGAKTKRRKKLFGPIIARQPRLKGGSSSLTSSDLTEMLENELQTGLVLTHDGYDKAMHSLLHLDFANLEVAKQSTNKWLADVSHIGNVQGNWALRIVGTAKVKEANGNDDAPANAVNDLGGMIRKKRKADGEEATQGTSAATERPPVNELSAGMIRKKPKVAPA